MEAFTLLFDALDATTRTSEKVAALKNYFLPAAPEDAAWALHFLSGRRLKRLVKTGRLRQWAAESSGMPVWLVEECYETVGDLAETLALLLPDDQSAGFTMPLHELVATRLLPLAAMDDAAQRELLISTWRELGIRQRLVWNKLITGSFRVGVSQTLLVRALAEIAGVEPAVMEHRLTGDWQPGAAQYLRLMAGDAGGSEPARPYPFCLAAPLEGETAALGEIGNWLCEWKWDGIRAQLIRRAGECILWSRGEEIISAAFPEIVSAAAGAIPDGTVLDGELLAWQGTEPLPFSRLQRRLNRREAALRLQREVPVIFMAYDLLESAGEDCRSLPLSERRSRLEQVIAATEASPAARVAEEAPAWEQGELFGDSWKSGAPKTSHSTLLHLSPIVTAPDWSALAALREESRARHAEGLMLKLRASPYGTGRHRGAWWKWKIAPFTADMVLVAAQPGHGRRATLFTDYTFAVWNGTELVPVAKAYSGLTDAEINEVDAYVRKNTTGRFGPVRTVKPELVFELAFEGIQESGRHKAGLALRFPRISRLRPDKKPADADSVESVRRLMNVLP